MRASSRSIWRTSVGVLALLNLVALANSLLAAPLTLTATGVVDFVDDALSGTFAPGQTFTLTYTFESTTPARAGSDSQFAVFDALTALDFTLDAYSGSATGNEEIQVDNDPPLSFHDRYSVGPGVTSVISGADVDGLALLDFFIRLDDDTDTVFSDALILPTSLSLSEFTFATFSVYFADENENLYLVSGPLTALVPEPTAFASALLACCALGYTVRRRERSHGFAAK